MESQQVAVQVLRDKLQEKEKVEEREAVEVQEVQEVEEAVRGARRLQVHGHR